jgi:C2 domain of PTEN tumour-suppressor protein/Protein-tyrosine phosphatase
MSQSSTPDLSPSNVPKHTTSSSLCCGISIRGLVSKKKYRFVEQGIDLDLSYITDRVIAMGFPSVGFEALYRNPADEVRIFLESRHAYHYRIWNLCCEKEYGKGHFNCEIERFTWADHTPPPLALIRPACESIDSWLFADSRNVCIIHCKAGKGRTGTLIACYLLHSRLCSYADQALQLFGTRRTQNGKGVTIPSQMRYVRYYAFQLAAQRFCVSRPMFQAQQVSTTETKSSISSVPTFSVASPFRMRKYIATALIQRLDTDPSNPPISTLTLLCNRDSDRTLGFSLDRVRYLEDHPDVSPLTAQVCPGLLDDDAVIVGFKVYDTSFNASIRQHRENHVQNSVNSVVPVPISDLLELGDVIISINEIDVRKKGFDEVISLLKGASDPLVIKVVRAHTDSTLGTPMPDEHYLDGWPEMRVINPDGSSRNLIPSSHPLDQRETPASEVLEKLFSEIKPTLDEYLFNISKAVGPWSRNSNPKMISSPTVSIRGVTLSHIPTIKSEGGLCGSTVLPPDAMFLQLYGGHNCQTLLFDSRYPSNHFISEFSSLSKKLLAYETCKSTRHASFSNVISNNDFPSLDINAPKGGICWGEEFFTKDDVIVSGDFRIAICIPNKKKPIGGAWFHTSMLPLPLSFAPIIENCMHNSPLVSSNESSPFKSPSVTSWSNEVIQNDIVGNRDVGHGLPTLGSVYSNLSDKLTQQQKTSIQDLLDVIPKLENTEYGKIVLTKKELDTIIKDKSNKKWDSNLELTIHYRARALPPQYYLTLLENKRKS